MSLQTRLGDLITAIGTDIKQLRTYITGSSSGSLTGLTTTDKTSVVSAINEVAASVAGIPTVPSASTSTAGKARYATDAEVLAMTENASIVRPSSLGAITNVANGLVLLDSGGKIASAQLPSYVDDVLEYVATGNFPATGAAGIIYVTTGTNRTYRWTGSVYVEISASPGSTDSVTEGSTNLYFTNTRADARADARILVQVGDVTTDLAALYTTAKA